MIVKRITEINIGFKLKIYNLLTTLSY